MTRLDAQPRDAVVVGVDRSPAAHHALDEAVVQAERMNRPLHILHATGIGIVPWTVERLQTQDHITDEFRDRARTLAPELPVTRDTVVADPAGALVEASQTAHVLVLDAGGLGHAAGVLLGATTHKVAAHSRCPVLVTPHSGKWDHTGPVVVGVDASRHSAPAVEWGFAEAQARGSKLVAVHSWWWEEPDPFLSGEQGEDQWREVVESQRLEVAEMLAGWHEKYPDVDVSTTLVRAQAVAALAEESLGAQLLVLGTRGRGGFTGLLLGSVSAHLVAHARCPVLVVPSPRST